MNISLFSPLAPVIFPGMDSDEQIEADILAEELTGKCRPAATTAEGIRQMEARIAYLERQAADCDDVESIREIAADLRAARERLAAYRAQQGQKELISEWMPVSPTVSPASLAARLPTPFDLVWFLGPPTVSAALFFSAGYFPSDY